MSETIKLPFSTNSLDVSQGTASLQAKISSLIELLRNHGNEAQWREVVLRDDMALPHNLAEALTSIRPDKSREDEQLFDDITRALFLLSNSARRVCANLLGCQHDVADVLAVSIEKAVSSSKLERLQLLTLILAHCPTRDLRVPSLDSAVKILFTQLSKSKDKLHDLLLQTIVLLNHHDTSKRIILYHIERHKKAKVVVDAVVKAMRAESAKGPVSPPTLQFIRNLFDFGRQEVLSNKDVFRIIDILIAMLETTDKSDEMLFEYLVCLEAVVSWKDYTASGSHKKSVIEETLAALEEELRGDFHFSQGIDAVRSWLEGTA